VTTPDPLNERRGPRKAKFHAGQMMRVKGTQAFVRLVDGEDGEALVDADGYVYVEPAYEIASWYNIDELTPVKRKRSKP
jgi:hypothetical protein